MEKASKKASKLGVWDCGSSLYDSFELKSFERQLDSAIASRTLSMPHVSDGRLQRHQRPPQPLAKKSFNISRSFQKLLRSVFRHKQNSSSLYNNNNNNIRAAKEQPRADRFYVVYDRFGALSTIPEAPETTNSPEIESLVRRTASDRFPAASIGISCA